MHIWPLHEAKNRLSEVVERSLKEGPQIVTRRGKEAVVILSIKAYRRLSGEVPGLMDCLLHAPRGEALSMGRSKEPARRPPCERPD